MVYRKMTALALVGLVSLLMATGCVSKTMFREGIAGTESRVEAVEDAVEANEKRVSDLRSETDSKLADVAGKADRAEKTGREAMSKADAAKMAADGASRGKLLWTVSLTNDQVKFGVNGTSIDSSAVAVLDQMVRQVKGMNRGVYLEIEGHTDSSGGDAFNHKLGEKRAMAVRDYLNEKGGMPLHLMSVISRGESQPAADNSTSAGRAQNRRVVIRVLE